MYDTRTADAGAAVSASLATLSWMAQLNEVMTFFASLAAIIAGGMAAMYHYEAWKQKRGKR